MADVSSSTIGGLAGFLQYGGLGLLGLLCVVVLGYNAHSLNKLIKEADAERLKAARPLLLAQMAVSVLGLVMLGAGAIHLQTLKERSGASGSARITLLPWKASYNALVDVTYASKKVPVQTMPLRVSCTDDGDAYQVNVQQLFDSVVDEAVQRRAVLVRPDASPGRIQ